MTQPETNQSLLPYLILAKVDIQPSQDADNKVAKIKTDTINIVATTEDTDTPDEIILQVYGEETTGEVEFENPLEDITINEEISALVSQLEAENYPVAEITPVREDDIREASKNAGMDEEITQSLVDFTRESIIPELTHLIEQLGTIGDDSDQFSKKTSQWVKDLLTQGNGVGVEDVPHLLVVKIPGHFPQEEPSTFDDRDDSIIVDAEDQIGRAHV